jgi:hypothetical protein
LEQETSNDVTITGAVGDADDVQDVRMSTVMMDDEKGAGELRLKSEVDLLQADGKSSNEDNMRDTGLINARDNFLDTQLNSARLNARRNQIEDEDGISVQEKELFNFASAPQNKQSAFRGNEPLKQRWMNLQDELQRKGFRGPDDLEFDRRNVANNSAYLMKMEEDSDDVLENFHSSQWGEGTSKVIAAHYNTLQNKHLLKAKQSAKSNKKFNENLTTAHFKEIGDQLAESRALK